ncbi:MAG: HD domain-containing protein [Peptococcaceae bacterium]|jgi:uncharacterized protein|nr:HD domain-containing protein [Peptococcaceae bacterium]
MTSLEEIQRFVEYADVHPALGMRHSQRVYRMAKELSQHLDLDHEVLFVAATLHDVGKFPCYALPNIDHPLRSKGVASALLQKIKFPAHKIPTILEAIETHMYYSDPGKTDEAVYLRDADILDNIGHIGIARLFSMVGQDELIQTPEDAVNRAGTLADALPNKTVTQTGRRLAIKRREEVLRFLSGLKRQTAEYAYL